MFSTVVKLIPLFAVAAVIFLAAPAVAAPSGTATELVARLYKDFGWQAFATNEVFGEGLEHQGKEALMRYFSPELAELLVKDRACQRKEQGICRLDFDILFDSQDPVVTDLDVKMGSAGKVRVSFKNLVNGQTTNIQFVVAHSGGKPKIVDVLYGAKADRSLKRLLQGP
jgi:hypothetical protein